MTAALNESVTVAIPTRNRRQLLQRAIRSCFSNRHRPIEIIVGYRADEDPAVPVVDSIAAPPGIQIRCAKTSKKKWSAINHLFALAQSARTIVLFDDSLMEPNAIDDFLLYWQDETDVAAFGKTRVVDLNGLEDTQESKSSNERTCRTFGYVGRQTSAIISAANGQFPDNGYMVLTSAAQAVPYRDLSEASCFDFGIRLAQRYADKSFLFTNKFALQVHQAMEDSAQRRLIWRDLFALLCSLDVSAAERFAIDQYIEATVAPRALLEHVRQGEVDKAFSIFVSEHYQRRRLSVGGLLHLSAIALPLVCRSIQPARTSKG